MWRVNALLAVTAAVLVAVGPLAESPPADGMRMPLWVVIAAFAASEVFVIHIHAGRSSRSFTSLSLSEVPLLIGLAFASPTELLVGRLIGSAISLLAVRRQGLVKLLFNVLLFAVETAAAIAIYHALLAGQGPASPEGWMAGFVAVGAATLLGTSVVHATIALHQQHWDSGNFREVARTSVVATFTNVTLGLVGVTTLAANPRAVWLLLGVAGLLLIAYRGYASLARKHASMEGLHDFTGAARRVEPGESSLRELLARTRALLRAEVAEVLIPSDGGRTVRRHRLDGSGDALAEVGLDEPGPLLGKVLASDAPLLVTRNDRSSARRALLRELGLRDAMLVPLRTTRSAAAFLLVGDRLGDVESFHRDDVQVLGTIANHVSVALDNDRLVEQLRQEAAEKEHQALHDALTGLPNRALFQARAEEAVAALPEGRSVAVLLLDLDRFKDVNDTLGHHVGDGLLQEVGGRLRSTMDPTATVARLGGDEFAVLLPAVADAREAVRVAERARAALERPFELAALPLVVGGSIGIALAPEHGVDGTELLQRADIAMYGAKPVHAGVKVYSSADDTHSPRRLALVGQLRHALATDGLDVHFQPKADLNTGEVIGVEALVRWTHPSEGPIYPDEFIPIAERTGLIEQVTEFVLRSALQQCREWRRHGTRIDVAVNLSASSLMDLRFPDLVRDLLEAASVSPRSLTLEITESIVMTDPVRALQVLTALHGMGVHLAVDDFGTGYSSLSQLKQMPVHELKIDRSFIKDMVVDDDDAMIVRSTIDLGHNLGLRVVAEGVEDRETWKRLRALGCDVVQGYYLSRALDAASFDAWLAEWCSGTEAKVLPPVDERLLGLDLQRGSGDGWA